VPTIYVYLRTLKAPKMKLGITISLSQRPFSTTHRPFLRVNAIARYSFKLARLTKSPFGFSILSAKSVDASVRAIAFPALQGRSLLGSGRTYSSLEALFEERESERSYPCDVFLGHHHAQTTVRTRNAQFQSSWKMPTVGSFWVSLSRIRI